MNQSIGSPLELGDIVRRFGPAFLQNQAERLLPSQRKALLDIASCHTPDRGGHRYYCNDCGYDFWVYHGCRNRSCPSCHTRAMRQWIEKREEQILPCRYFHLVVTVPQPIRPFFLAHQKLLYGLLMKTVSSSLIDLARDPKFLGATPAILAVLHTWRGDLGFHPHLHLLVSAGGVTEDGHHWIESPYKRWLVPVHALSKLIRLRFRARLKKYHPELFKQIDPNVWKNGWNSFSKPHGQGPQAVLDYLGRYVYRVAITNSRLLSMDDTHVTFRYKDNEAHRSHTMRLPADEFLRRFVMHVLPRGFHKVRYYGLWHHSQRQARERIHLLLALQVRLKLLAELVNPPSPAQDPNRQDSLDSNELQPLPVLPTCPHCKSQNVRLIQTLHRNRSP